MGAQLWAGLGILVLLFGGAGFAGWLNRSAGRNEAKLKADESTLRQVQTGNDVAREVDAASPAERRERLHAWDRQ